MPHADICLHNPISKKKGLSYSVVSLISKIKSAKFNRIIFGTLLD